jgi:3-hydroxymyristoyl/3-hydroxydecanoyl-(acyl carrier protein) dehydratase
MLLQNLYSVEFKDDTKAIVKLSDKNHPVFKAHFPQKPILPGFVNLEIISDVFNFEITNIKKAKFLGLIEPNQTLVFKRIKNSFKVFCGDKEVANFSL